jgi:hypothetical protein
VPGNGTITEPVGAQVQSPCPQTSSLTIWETEFHIVAASIKPIIQRAVRPFTELAFKAALAAQSGKIARPRSRNNEPRRLDLALLDDFPALKYEGTLASVQLSAESLHANEAGRMFGA